MILREPVSHAISFFAYQKIRLRFPADMSIADYLTEADGSRDDDFPDPANEKYIAVRGGCYADYLPAWLDVFGTEGLHVMSFEELVADPSRASIHPHRGWVSTPPSSPRRALSSENRTTGFKNKSFQEFALKANDRLERVLRRHPDAKRKLRAFYYKINGRLDEIPQSGARPARRSLSRAEHTPRCAARCGRHRAPGMALALGPSPLRRQRGRRG